MLGPRGVALAVAVLVAAAPARTAAQTALTVDGSAARLAYADGAGQSSWTLTPRLQVSRDWQSLTAGGTYAQFPGGLWSFQTQTEGSAYSRPLFGIRAELGASASATWHEDQSRSGQYLGTLRLHRFGPRRGMWVGGDAGRAWDGVSWRTEALGELGGWVRVGSGTLSATFAPTGIGDSLRFLDWSSTLRVSSGPLELAAFGGLRHWTRPAGAAGAGWGGVSAAYWLSGHFAVTAAGGTYPTDYAQNLPNGSYGSVGLRIAVGRVDRQDARESSGYRLPKPQRRDPTSTAFAIHPVSGDSIDLRIRAAAATKIEVMGDFTAWQPRALAPGPDGWWSVALVIPAGVHRMNVRIDGAAWGVPPGVTSVEDEFSGVVGIFAVP